MGAFRREEVVYIAGEIAWCMHLRPEPTYNKWKVTMYLTGNELEKARELLATTGIKNTIKKDEHGWFITLSRRTNLTSRGQIVGLEPPQVFTMAEDGITKIPVTVQVGNGSVGVAKCVLWSSKNFPGKNLRWEALKIDSLIPYSSNDYPDQGASSDDLAEQGREYLF